MFKTVGFSVSVLGLATGILAAEIPDLDHHPGKTIYRKLCLDCHGPGGEAVEDKTDEPLRGNRDIASLAGRIERTMPEDAEDRCVGDDARQVAEYIYHAFYSAEARARNTPARIELTRLTVPQYRNSVADLALGFSGKIDVGSERGLKGAYYGGYRFNEREEQRKQKKKDWFEKRDSRVKFDFGEAAPALPEAADFNAREFSIRWKGTLLPEETGVYEFVIRTRNGATLRINEPDRDAEKTIDAWVAPNNETREETGRIFLIGGRPVPIELEFFKYKEKAASIELLWNPPHGMLETIPEHRLTPDPCRESLIVSTPFPADDRSVGYERGTSVSRAWLDAVTAGAVQAADYVVEHLDQLARTKPGEPGRPKKIGEFGVQFVERAFRRPLAEEERKRFVDRHFDEAETLEQAVRRLVLFTLTAPRFLYPGLRETGGKPDQWDLASRLALALWDSLPDEALRNRVRNGHLANPNQIETESERMVRDWRSRAKLRGFFHHWLELERADDLSKDRQVFPEFDEAVLTDLRTSLNLFLDEAVWGDQAGYRELLLADYLFLNERLGKLYGKSDLEGGFQKVALDRNRRSGIITHPFLLSSLAYHNNTSPIHRGVFLTRNIVGMSLKSPPMANEFEEGKFDPTLTMREKVTEMTRAKACMGCHITINPLGFSLEHYDGIGRWRSRDRNKPVDATGDFTTEAGETIKLTGARDVAEFAANQPSAHRAFIQQLFHHTVKQPVRAYGEGKMEELRAGFEQSNFSVPQLLKQIALTAAKDPR